MHAFFSLSLLSPAYYDKYFDDVGQLNLQGEIALSVGVVALFFLLSPAVTTLPMMPKAIGGWLVEAEPTSRLRRPGPRCGPPGGPRHQRLVGATGMARRDTPGELGRRCSGTGATAGQAQGGERQEGAGCLEARSGFGQLMERLVNQKLTRKRIIATSFGCSRARCQTSARVVSFVVSFVRLPA